MPGQISITIRVLLTHHQFVAITSWRIGCADIKFANYQPGVFGLLRYHTSIINDILLQLRDALAQAGYGCLYLGSGTLIHLTGALQDSYLAAQVGVFQPHDVKLALQLFAIGLFHFLGQHDRVIAVSEAPYGTDCYTKNYQQGEKKPASWPIRHDYHFLLLAAFYYVGHPAFSGLPVTYYLLRSGQECHDPQSGVFRQAKENVHVLNCLTSGALYQIVDRRQHHNRICSLVVRY